MKTTITTLLILFISIQCNSQIQVHLKNGDIVEGNIGLFKKDIFKLKQTKKGKAEKFKAEDTDSILFINKRKTEVYHSIEHKRKKFLYHKLELTGKLILYVDKGMTTSGYGSYETVNYTIIDAESNEIVSFNGGLYNSNWTKNAVEYFSVCPTLSKKIESRDENFKRKDLLNIVKYFNEKCN